MLLALYQAKAPLTRDDLVATGGKAVWTECAAIRSAGVDLPRGGRWLRTYSLTPQGKDQVREAFAHTASLLPNNETEALRTRITVLEDALGMTGDLIPSEYGLTQTEARIFGMIAKRPTSKERIYWSLYGDRSDPPDDKVIDVMVSKIRAKIALFGLQIVNHYGEGFSLKRPEKLAA